MIDFIPRRLLALGVTAAGLVVIAGMIYIFSGREAQTGATLVAVALTGIVGLLFVLRVPTHWLPAIALIAFAVVPTRLTPSGFTFRMTLWALLLLLWLFRRVFSRDLWDVPLRAWLLEQVLTPWRAIAILSGVAFLVWAAVATLRGSFLSAGVSWMISLTICAMLPMFAFNAQREAVLLRKAWVILAAVLSLYAMLELVLQGSPLYGTVYELAGLESVQHWSLYRAEATFGHPLLAGSFFTVGAALGFGAWLQGSRPSDLWLAVLAAGGVVATVSRGPMLAVAVLVAVSVVAVALMNPNRTLARPAAIVIAGLIAAVGVLNFEPVTARSGNADAEISADARNEGITVAFKAAEFSNWLGSGAATSGITGRYFSEVVIENSLLQLMISVGIPGLVLFVIWAISLMGNALSVKDVAPAAALFGFLICISGYNAIDAVRPSHLLLGFLVIICLNPVHPPEFSNQIRSRRFTAGATIFRTPDAPAEMSR